MKIIYYSPHPTHDIVSEVGYSTHQREVIYALKELGHEVVPVVLGGTEISNLNPLSAGNHQPSMIKKVLKWLVPSFIWTSLNNFKLRRHDKYAAAKLEQSIIEFQPDLIYERSEYLQDSGTKLSLKYKIKHIIEVNAPLVDEMREFEGYSLYENKAHQIEKYKFRHADKVIVVSSSLAKYCIEKYECNQEKIFVQPNCINPSKLNLDLKKVEELKGKYNKNDEKIIGFVGSMFPYHGVDLLIRAFSQVIKDYFNVKLLIIGDGIVLNDLKKLSEELNIKNKVEFTGKIAHSGIFEHIQIMDICIMAKSNWYGSPVKIFEYGLMKKPIIAPDTEPVKDVMENMKEALIIGNDVTELKLAIEKLLNDETLSQKLANNFHDKIMNEYNWRHAAENIIKLCE